jgi:outer membrane protein TolC
LLERQTLKPSNPNWTSLYDPTIELASLLFIRKLKPFTKMTYLCPHFSCANNTGETTSVRKRVMGIADTIRLFGNKSPQVEVEVLEISKDNYSDIIMALNTDMVFVPNLYAFTDEQCKEIFSLLTEKKILSITQEGMHGVEQGAVAAVSNFDFQRIARKTALHLYNILIGMRPSELIVTDNWKVELIFNQQTAREIGYDIPLEFLYDAIVVGKSEESKRMTMQDAVKTALKQNPDLKLKVWDRKQSALNADIVKGGYFPHLGTNVSYAQIDKARAHIQPSPEKQSRFEVSLFQNIYNRELSKTIEVAKLDEAAAKGEISVTKQDLILSVIMAYIDFMLAEDNVKDRREQLRILRKHLDIVLLRHDLESAGRSDVLRMEIQYNQGRMELVEAIRDLDKARAALIYLLHLPKETEFEITDRDEFSETNFRKRTVIFDTYYQTQGKLKLFREFLIQKAYAHSVNLKLLKTRLEQAHQNRERMLAKFWPTLDFSVQWFRQFSDDHRDIRPTPYVFENFHNTEEEQAIIADYKVNEVNKLKSIYDDANVTGWNSLIKLSWPIFSGGSRFSELRKAETEIKEAKTAIEKMKSELARLIRTTYFDHYTLRNNTQIAIKDADLARENLALAETAYLNGSIATIDMLDIQSNLILSETNATLHRYRFIQSVARLLHLISHVEAFVEKIEDPRSMKIIHELETFFQQHIDN